MCAAKLNPEKPVYFTILTAASIILLLTNWILALIEYPQLPDTIPSHFNAKGVVDGYSNKATVFLLPAVASFTLAILLMTGPLNTRFRSVSFSRSVQLSPLTEARIVKVISVLCALLFLVIEVFMIYSAKNGSSPAEFYLVFILTGIIVVYPFVEMVLDKRKR
ncbi:DUF1648 domain-containing protein [Flavihumibacter sp. CACIAM 22H1]|uniref:DUF1648 domain-containing protein n=1 Tax=Flavihumibacter sp. CACIAM 22H1 TaxID=1812911 RepID=UPI0007A83684|nr:DUF1648 domain-containing protein [Flavihumibacter sp. CACIAM 22H1]KYP16045.1 MAG: hypothetical protein A1D16_18405 [Flavihumibacter sp. CACIAM 22H1]